MASPPAFAFDTAGLPDLGSYLLVYPEQVVNGLAEDFSYAEVVDYVSDTVLTVTTRGNLSFTYDVSSAALGFQRVSQEEYNDPAELGTYLRKAVLVRVNRMHYYRLGRSYAFASSTLNVRTSRGATDCGVMEVVSVEAPLAMLLFHQDIPMGAMFNGEMQAMHELIITRLVRDPSLGVAVVSTVAEALEGFAPVPAVLILEWCDPCSGMVALCGLDNVMRLVRYAGLPVPSGVSVGANFCDDPAHRPKTAGACDDEDFLSPNIKYTWKRRTDRDGHSTRKGNATSQVSFDDLDELLAAHRDTADGRRDIPGLEEHMGAQVTVPDAKPNKYTFDPSPSQRLAFKAMYSHRLPPGRVMSLLRKWAANTRIGFIAYPALLVRLYDFQFGYTGGLSVAHFRPRTAADLVALHQATEIDMSNFSEHTSKLPKADTVETLADLRACVNKLQEFFTENGSPLARHLVAATVKFLEDFSTSSSSTQRNLKSIVVWIDQTYQLYRYELGQDLERPHGYGNRHKTIYARLDKRHPDLQDVFRENDSDKVDTLCSKRGHDDDAKKAKRQKQDANGNDRDAASKDWFGLVPKAANGKTICARFLSNKGCPSTIKGKCDNQHRVHVWPTQPLDDALIGVITKLWGGVNPLVPKRV